MRRKIWTDEQGMTLIEVMVVMLIIGVLSAIAVPYFGRVQQQARDKKMMTDMRNIAVAIGVYKVDNDQVPIAASATELIEILKNDQGGASPLTDKDPWGNYFAYTANVATNSYTLRSLGRDGQVSTLASQGNFDVDNDTVIVDGMFVASHQGAASIAH